MSLSFLAHGILLDNTHAVGEIDFNRHTVRVDGFRPYSQNAAVIDFEQAVNAGLASPTRYSQREEHVTDKDIVYRQGALALVDLKADAFLPIPLGGKGLWPSAPLLDRYLRIRRDDDINPAIGQFNSQG